MKMKYLLITIIFISLLQTASAAYVPDFEFTKIYDEYFTDGFRTWDVLSMAGDLYMTRLGSFLFWGILFGVVYISLHITTGGMFIPTAAFSAVGSVLILVMPSELSAPAKIILTVGLFVVPIYKYVTR